MNEEREMRNEEREMRNFGSFLRGKKLYTEWASPFPTTQPKLPSVTAGASPCPAMLPRLFANCRDGRPRPSANCSHETNVYNSQSPIVAGRLYKLSRKRFSRVESCSILLPPERKRLETQNKKEFVKNKFLPKL